MIYVYALLAFLAYATYGLWSMAPDFHLRTGPLLTIGVSLAGAIYAAYFLIHERAR